MQQLTIMKSIEAEMTSPLTDPTENDVRVSNGLIEHKLLRLN